MPLVKSDRLRHVSHDVGKHHLQVFIHVPVHVSHCTTLATGDVDGEWFTCEGGSRTSTGQHLNGGVVRCLGIGVPLGIGFASRLQCTFQSHVD